MFVTGLKIVDDTCKCDEKCPNCGKKKAAPLPTIYPTHYQSIPTPIHIINRPTFGQLLQTFQFKISN